MRNDIEERRSAFKQLAREFSKCRRSRQWYSADLKRRAIGLVRSGSAAADVAGVLKISVQSISNWQKTFHSLGAEAPVELQVRSEERSRGDGAFSTPAEPFALARLCFGSGVEVHLPVAALTIELLKSLRHLGAGQC